MTELVATRGDALQRYAMLLCGSREQAADLVQDALVKTFGRLRNGFSVESAEAYVRRAILNGHLDGGRRLTRWRKVAPLEYVPDEQPSARRRHRPARTTCTRSCASSARASAPAWCCATTTTSRSTTSPRPSASAPGTVKRYLSDGLAKMALSLADDGTVADRLGPPAPTGTDDRRDGSQCPAILSSADASARAPSPAARSMWMPCCAARAPAVARGSSSPPPARCSRSPRSPCPPSWSAHLGAQSSRSIERVRAPRRGARGRGRRRRQRRGA